MNDENKKDISDFYGQIGMSGMEMRAKLLGGKFTVKSSAETGTQILVEFDEK